jgi:hypothetical protein
VFALLQVHALAEHHRLADEGVRSPVAPLEDAGLHLVGRERAVHRREGDALGVSAFSIASCSALRSHQRMIWSPRSPAHVLADDGMSGERAGRLRRFSTGGACSPSDGATANEVG